MIVYKKGTWCCVTSIMYVYYVYQPSESNQWEINSNKSKEKKNQMILKPLLLLLPKIQFKYDKKKKKLNSNIVQIKEMKKHIFFA